MTEIVIKINERPPEVKHVLVDAFAIMCNKCGTKMGNVEYLYKSDGFDRYWFKCKECDESVIAEVRFKDD